MFLFSQAWSVLPSVPFVPTGGHCQISFGDYVPPQQTARYGQPQPLQQGLPAGTTQAPEQPFQIGGNAPSGNNYARPGGQNVGECCLLRRLQVEYYRIPTLLEPKPL